MTAQEPRAYRILIVDDLPHERAAIRAAIAQGVGECRFVEADSVEAAERVLRDEAFPFDLAAIDLKLPEDTEGLTVVGIIKQVLRRHSQTRVIVLTAWPSVETTCAAYEAGAAAYLDKGDKDSTAKLQAKARELLELSDLRESLRRQYESQRRAEAALSAHRRQWARKHGGKFVLVRDGKVLAARDNPHELLVELEKHDSAERLEIGIVEVPPPEQDHGDR